MKSPAASSDEGKHHIIDDFIENNFNVLIVHYCTSDLYQGTHINKLMVKTFTTMVVIS